MRVLDLYFAKSIIFGILLASMLFAGLFFFFFFIKELNFVGTADYTVTMAVLYVLLRLPGQLYELAPSIILVGSLLSLGAMAASSELVVLRAAGMSTMAITRMVMQAGLLVALLVAAAGEFLVPKLSFAGSMRIQAMNQSIIAGGEQGVWSRDGNRYINIGKVHPDGRLTDLSIYQIDDHGRLHSSVSVKQAVPAGNGWRLSGVQESLFDDDRVVGRQYAEVSETRLIQRDLFEVLKSEPEDMSARALHQYGEYLQANELDADIYRLQFWIKLFTPVTCLVMLLIALPLVFTSNARSGGVGQRVMIGLSIGILFYVFNRMVNYTGLSYGVHPALSAAIPPLLAAFVVFILLRRI